MPRRGAAPNATVIDPYATFNFRLVLADVEVAGFMECTGLSVETKVLEVMEGGRNDSALKFPEGSSFGNITLKRGITQAVDLLNWQMDVVAGTFRTNHRRRTVSAERPPLEGEIAIELLDELGRAVRRWTLLNAFPVKWLGPDLKASASEVAVETLELAHEGWVEEAVTP